MTPRFVRRVIGVVAAATLGFVAHQGRGVVLGLVPQGLIAEAVAQSPPPLDHFQCYQSKEASEFPRFTPITNVTTVDPFGSWLFDALKPVDICTPANVNGSDGTAPTHPEHLETYQIKRVPGTAKFMKVLNQHVVDHFGGLTVDVLKPEKLMLPTAKSVSGPPSPPTSPVTDHFTCYKIRISPGASKFIPVLSATIADQFGGLTVDIVKPRSLCVATNKEDEEPGAETHAEHLICYKAKLRSTFIPIRTYDANQFGHTILDARKVVNVCVPSQLNPSGATPTPTQTTAVTPTSAATPTSATPTRTLTPTGTSTVTPTPTVTPTGLITATPTKTATPTATKTPTPSVTATPISRVCTIGGTESRVALQVKNAPIVGNARVIGQVTGTQTLQFGGQDANGVRQILIPAGGIHFDPVNVPPPANVKICIFPTGPDGLGKIDCNGGDPDYNITTQRDHNTSNPPGANGGLPQDPECDDTRSEPDGTVSSACLESAGGGCNPTNPHVGVCNSPVEYVTSGTFASGAARVVEYLTLRLVQDVGPDGMACTDDDTYSPPANVRTYLTTGVAHTAVFDANNVADTRLEQGAPGCANCITEVTGLPKSCNSITGSGGMTNVKFVGALPLVDIDASVGDAAVTIEIKCQ